jgi:SAM-dependent methyltransferase
MARLLFIVEDTFLIKGRGLVPIPGIIPQGEERFKIGDPICLKRPDGSSLEWRIDGLELAHTPPPWRGVHILLNGLGKEDIPVGTEVWSIDPPGPTEKTDRSRARTLAAEYLSRDRPIDWFEVLYAEAEAGRATVPWADLEPNPNLVAWLDTRPAGDGKKALVVGCGLGDDVEELARRRFEAVGFDVSATAIEACRRRFPHSRASYAVADLFHAPHDWHRRFDLVVEAYTLQVLPPAERHRAIPAIADFVAPGGRLLVITRGRSPGEDEGQMPWPLTRDEVMRFGDAGLALVECEDYLDDEDPPVRRLRASFRRPGQGP